MTAEKDDTGSSLMKMVEAIAITPQDARAVVEQCEAQARISLPTATNEKSKISLPTRSSSGIQNLQQHPVPQRLFLAPFPGLVLRSACLEVDW